MSQEFYLGEVTRFKAKFYNSAGALTDPTAVTCTASVDGVTKVDNAAMTKSSTGIYYYEVTLNVAGSWDLWAKGTSGNLIQIQHDQIQVNPSVPYALCTLQEAKNHLNIALTTTTYDAKILALIDQTTGAIEDFCKRRFAMRTYAHERHNGNGTPYIFLDNYPVIDLTRFSDDVDGVIKITCTNSVAADAYVNVDVNELRLVIVGGTNAGTDTVSKVTYATLTAVITQINTLSAKGWAAEIVNTNWNNFPSTDLLDQFGQRCLSTYIWLEMPGTRQAGFKLNKEAGEIQYDYNTTRGEIQNVVVDYVGGYRVIPESVKGVALKMVAYQYHKNQRDPSLKSENLGDYGYTAAEESLNTDGAIRPGSALAAELGQYQRINAR